MIRWGVRRIQTAKKEIEGVLTGSMRIAAAFLTLLATTSMLSAATYVDDKPIVRQIRKDIRDCRQTNVLKVPTITWGADIVTSYANGNAKTTQRGSVFAQEGLNIQLFRQDNFAKQVEAYLRCETPFLRATLGMANLVADITENDPRTKMIAIHQLSWSAGGDALVVKPGIEKPSDLRGKTIVVQKGGPHVDYLMTIIGDAGLTIDDIRVKWVEELTGIAGKTPADAFRDDEGVHAAMVIIPDALTLTSNGTVGTGSEGSVRGSKILLSTKTANRIIADLYFVRADYFNAHRDIVEKFTHGWLQAEETAHAILRTESTEKKDMLMAAAELLLDARSDTETAAALWADAETVGWGGNNKFFNDRGYPRRFTKLNSEIQSHLVTLGQVAGRHQIASARWDYASLAEGLSRTEATDKPRFDEGAVSGIIARKQAQGALNQDTLFQFEINFRPNQNTFPIDIYRNEFLRAIELSSTYAGAILTIEGHADPLGYLRRKKKGENQVVLNRLAQSARNLSLSRAQAVRDNMMELAAQDGITLDKSQFTVFGSGFGNPKTGICGNDPCAPKTENEWLSNMRVVFRIVNMEAEASAFVPLD